MALALHSLIKSQFPRDNLYLVTFSLYARQIQPQQLTALRWSEWEYGTNLQDGLMHARKLLARHKGGTRQIVVITDGEPTAYWEPGSSTPVLSYPPTPRTLQQTLLEVGRCTREGLRINTFMLERSYGLMRFVDDITRINRGGPSSPTPNASATTSWWTTCSRNRSASLRSPLAESRCAPQTHRGIGAQQAMSTLGRCPILDCAARFRISALRD